MIICLFRILLNYNSLTVNMLKIKFPAVRFNVLLLAGVLVFSLGFRTVEGQTAKPFCITESPDRPVISDFGPSLKSPALTADDEARAEILKSMQHSQDCWNSGDLVGFMHNYWRSDSLKFVGKTGITYGWDASLKRYQLSYPDRSKQGTLRFNYLHLDKISEDAWYQIGKYTLTRENDTLSGHFMLIWRKIDGQWRIVADHSS